VRWPRLLAKLLASSFVLAGCIGHELDAGDVALDGMDGPGQG
jgi:hypothetical protein